MMWRLRGRGRFVDGDAIWAGWMGGGVVNGVGEGEGEGKKGGDAAGP